MFGKMQEFLLQELKEIQEAGLQKKERVITSPQGAEIRIKTGQKVINFCANNYLGLGSHPEVIAAAHRALDQWGYGLSSVRFICGTQDIHKQLEQKIAQFLGMEDAILYSSCFDANGGVFEALLKEEDAVISDALNHASLIDGIRLCKAQRFRYVHADMTDLESQLQQTQSCRFRLIATDGVFSMDGDIAKLSDICNLAEKYNAIVMVDDSHATGFIGKTGRGTHEHHQVMGRVDIITSTLGKALGGASGGFICGHKPVIDMLRQRSRPYLFSNTIPPMITATAIAVIDLLSSNTTLRDKVEKNCKYFRAEISKAGFKIKQGEHPIVPIMLGDAKLANQMADKLLEHGIYVIGFSYPVVPKGEARIRVQISAAHETAHLDQAITAFAKVGKNLGVI
jgi:glycine C-acetyltransferase